MMNMKLAILVGCITAPVLPVWAGAASSPASGNVEEHVIEHWKKQFPQATYIDMPKAGHYIQEDAPDQIIEAIGGTFGPTPGEPTT